MSIIIKNPKPLPVKKKVPPMGIVQLAATPTKIVGKQPTASVTKAYKDGSTTETQEEVGPVKMLQEPHATVGVTIGVTRNLGNFESVKVTVSLFMPSVNTEEALTDTYNEVKGWVDNRVEHLNQEISEQLAS